MTPFAEAHAALLRNGALQFDLPSGSPTHAPPPAPLNFGFGQLDVVWLLAILAAALAIGLAVAYARAHPSTPSMPVAEPDEPALAPARARLALGDADRLAAEGRHLDAARLLLACGLDAIAKRYPGLLRPTTTSRDLAREPALPSGLRTGFAQVARAVEVGLFGGRPIGPQDYAECRQAFVTSALGGET